MKSFKELQFVWGYDLRGVATWITPTVKRELVKLEQDHADEINSHFQSTGVKLVEIEEAELSALPSLNTPGQLLSEPFNSVHPEDKEPVTNSVVLGYGIKADVEQDDKELLGSDPGRVYQLSLGGKPAEDEHTDKLAAVEELPAPEKSIETIPEGTKLSADIIDESGRVVGMDLAKPAI